MLSGKGIANPSPIAIPWTHSSVASKLGTSSLKQSRPNGAFRLMEFTQTLPMFCSISARFLFNII